MTVVEAVGVEGVVARLVVAVVGVVEVMEVEDNVEKLLTVDAVVVLGLHKQNVEKLNFVFLYLDVRKD